MEETFDQKIIRNIQGQFSVYKTTEVVGDKSQISNLEWDDSENVDGFFSFAKKVNTQIIYLTEGEEYNEETNETKTTILQIGFLYQGVMHHINMVDEDEDDSEEYEDDEYEEESEDQYSY
jgi:hypothetical protein